MRSAASARSRQAMRFDRRIWACKYAGADTAGIPKRSIDLIIGQCCDIELDMVPRFGICLTFVGCVIAFASICICTKRVGKVSLTGYLSWVGFVGVYLNLSSAMWNIVSARSNPSIQARRWAE
jgi:hypothetical protein